MSDFDVHPHEMNAPHDFDDAAAEALVSGLGHDVDHSVADLVADMRVAYTSQAPALTAELSALIVPQPAPAPATPPSRRFERMRASLIAKVGAATATLIAATGGLAVAHALPAPVQDAASHLGIGARAHHRSSADRAATINATTVDATQITTPEGDTTSTTAPSGDNHGNGSGAAASHNGESDACDDHSTSPEPDADDATDATTTPDSAVPCAPSTETATPQPAEQHHDGNSGNHDQSGDSNGTAATVPSPDTHGGGGSDHGGSSGSDSSGGSNGGGDHGSSSASGGGN